MTLAAIKTERADLNARWNTCCGTGSDEELAIKARIDELVELEATVTPMPKRKARIARHCNDHGVS